MATIPYNRCQAEIGIILSFALVALVPTLCVGTGVGTRSVPRPKQLWRQRHFWTGRRASRRGFPRRALSITNIFGGIRVSASSFLTKS